MSSPHTPFLAAEAERRRGVPRGRVLETLAIVVAVLAVEVVGTLVLALASGVRASLLELAGVLGVALSPRTLIWLALAAGVQLTLREASRRRRWTLVLLAAPVAVLLPTIISTVQYWHLAGAAWFGLPFVLHTVVFTATVGLGLLIAAAVRSGRFRATALAAAVLVALGAMLTLALMWQFIAVNLAFFGEPPTVTAADAERYVTTASVAAVTYVAAVVLATVSRVKALVITSLAGAALGLAVVIVLRVTESVPGY